MIDPIVIHTLPARPRHSDLKNFIKGAVVTGTILAVVGYVKYQTEQNA